MIYYAHSTDNPDKSDWQLLQDHLSNTAHNSELFASNFNAAAWGKRLGLLHDAGKATLAFQQRLEGKNIRVDHSSFGAQKAQQQDNKFGWLLAYAIAGHHGGMPNGGFQPGQLHYRLTHASAENKVELLPEGEEKEPLLFPFLPNSPQEIERKWAMFSFSFFTRMLYSCLVDADFLDTEAFCSPDRAILRKAFNQKTDFAALKASLLQSIDEKKASATPSTVNTCRQEILAACLKESSGPQGFYSLTVPTGGGKTLSSLAFALSHAHSHKLNRVIYTIPFTSIIEQNAEVFRKAVGPENVLEHHSSYQVKDDENILDKWRSATAENWDAPIVVTTNVQFFESLFAHKPSKCRKLHNIAKSVIIIDEAQAIPTEYLEPCLAALKELAQRYHCTVVLCTATQPALDETTSVEMKVTLPQPKEIIPNPQALFDILKRTRIEFTGTLNNEELAARMMEHRQVLTITATKKQAQEVFALLGENEGNFHLSTNLYPAHRQRVLQKIRERVKAGQPCKIVSTNLVEAGVDIDLPVVYRAMAGLDSIAQAAGRCNREGKLEYGMVYIYEPEEMPSMPWLKRRMIRAGEALRKFPDQDCLLPEPMRCYFELLYDVDNLDSKEILRRLNPPPDSDFILPFKDIAEDFHLIEEDGCNLIIPSLLEDKAKVTKLLEELRYTEFPHTARRKLQRYTVTVRRRTFEQMNINGAVEIIREQYPVLCNHRLYSEKLGLHLEKAELWDPLALIA